METIYIEANLNFFNPNPNNFNPKEWIEYWWLNDSDDFELEKLLWLSDNIDNKIVNWIYEELDDYNLIDKRENRLNQFIWAKTDTHQFKLKYKKSWKWYSIFISLIDEDVLKYIIYEILKIL